MSAALCDQCDALAINGLLCHETGCPRERRERATLRARTCGECGTVHEEPETAAECCAPVDCEDTREADCDARHMLRMRGTS